MGRTQTDLVAHKGSNKHSLSLDLIFFCQEVNSTTIVYGDISLSLLRNRSLRIDGRHAGEPRFGHTSPSKGYYITRYSLISIYYIISNNYPLAKNCLDECGLFPGKICTFFHTPAKLRLHSESVPSSAEVANTVPVEFQATRQIGEVISGPFSVWVEL
jgi:hypothetical protein